MGPLPPGVRLRFAKDADAFAVAALCLQQGRELAVSLSGAAVADAGFIDRFADAWLQQRPGRLTWLAECEDGRPVGVASAAFVEGLPRPGGQARSWLQVTTLFVTRDRRRQGLGRALLEAAVAEGQARGVTGVRAEGPPEAARLLDRLGFARPGPHLLELRLRG